MTYPPAQRVDADDELHGHHIADPYRWLEDPDDPRTVAWSAGQDELFAAERAGWAGLDEFHDRLAELLAVGVVTAPVWRRGRPFFVRRTGEQEHAVLVTADPDGTERVLVDPMALDPTGATTLDYWYPSHEGALLAYGQSTGGTEDSALYVLDVASGKVVDGPVDRARYTAIGWLPGGSAFYYMRHLDAASAPDDNARLHRRVYLRRLQDEGEDALVFGDGSPRGRYFTPAVSTDGRWLVISEAQGTDPRNDVWVADLTSSTVDEPVPRPVQLGVDASTTLRFRGGRAYLLTDRDAPRGRLCVAEPDALEYEAWRDLVAEDPEAVLEDFVVLDGDELARPVLVVSRTRHAVAELTIHDGLTGARLGAVEVPGLGSVTALTAAPVGGHEAWFTYTDYATPDTVHRYDALTGEVSVWARPPGFDAAAGPAAGLTARQVTYESTDGTPVRMFLLSATGAPPGPRPTILYGYGGFNISLVPGYTARAIAWVEAGGVYAVANLRGGSEEGEQWHRAGMLANKQNVFDDFAAAADWLVSTGVTTPERLAIFGGSNGGLLVGAALTQHPERYAAAVCSAPLLDMVRYERFGLGSTWAGEYGTAEDPEQLGWLLAYSPYHHVEDGTAYPAVLFTVFDSDTRVDPLHARKLAAALQHATRPAGPARRPVLLRRETEVGHASRAVTRTVELEADELAFLAAHTGLA